MGGGTLKLFSELYRTRSEGVDQHESVRPPSNTNTERVLKLPGLYSECHTTRLLMPTIPRLLIWPVLESFTVHRTSDQTVSRCSFGESEVSQKPAEPHTPATLQSHSSYPEGPSTQNLRSLIPKTIPCMVFGTRVMKYWVLGPSELHHLSEALSQTSQAKGPSPEGPSTQYLRTLVPKAIKGMVFGIRVRVNIGKLDRLGIERTPQKDEHNYQRIQGRT